RPLPRVRSPLQTLVADGVVPGRCHWSASFQMSVFGKRLGGGKREPERSFILLIMRSGPTTTTTLERPGAGDLTARAKVRDAALELFARQGYAATSVREIAAAAGVSPALLFHHFGSKQGLRDAVDAWLTDTIAAAVAETAADAEGAGGPAALTARFRRFAEVGRVHPAINDYVARILTEG